MPKKLGNGDTDQFSVTLPVKAIEMMEELIGSGLFGSSRGEVARNLILDRLKQLAAYRLVKTHSAHNEMTEPMDKA